HAAATEPTARHAASKNATPNPARIRSLDNDIQLRATDVEVIAQPRVAGIHQRAEFLPRTTLQGVHCGERALIFRGHVPRATEEAFRQLLARFLDALGCGVAQFL